MSRQVRIVLVIVAANDERFLLRADGIHLRCPQFVLSVGDLAGDNLAELIERSSGQHLSLRLTYLGMLSSGEPDGLHELVVLCALREMPRRESLEKLDCHLISLPDMRRASQPIERLDLFEVAAQWRLVETSGHRLFAQIEQALDMGMALLASHVSEEDELRGWSQYLDGRTVGALSTAQGLLAHVHAGKHGSVLDEMAATLEAIQNPDGGWQVRRALVGRPSERSITESTCYCLWALSAAGRTATNATIQKGVTWLELNQVRDNGGWQSAVGSSQPNVVATAAAVRVLARFGRHDAAERGVKWLRSAQLADGSWAATSGTNGSDVSGSPAYAAHAILALRANGVASEDAVVRRGCQYLRRTFDPSADEPWRSTSVNAVVDDKTSARMEFRLFATPWVLTALCAAARNIGDPMVYVGTAKLLALQESNGAWRCMLTAPGANTIWAVHDALLSLRSVLDASTRDLAAIALSDQREAERSVLQEAIRRLLLASSASNAHRDVGRRWLFRGWLSALTAAVALLIASQAGLLHGLQSTAGLQGMLTTGFTVLIAAIVAIAPVLLAEEYKLWRRRRSSN